MRSATRLMIPAAILAATLGCFGGSSSGGDQPTHPLPTPDELVGTKLATVDGHAVGSEAFHKISARTPPANGATFSVEEKQEILDQVIADELMFREAFSKGLYHDPKVRRILVNQLLRDEAYAKIEDSQFTQDKLEAYFQEHRETFVIPEKVQVQRIFVAIDDDTDDAAAKARAEELRTELMADPEAFRDVAIASSEGPFARRGGDLGYLDRDGKPGIPGKVVARAFATQAGEFAEVFEAAGGYNVVYVPSRRERIERTFEQMRGAVLRQMKVEAYNDLTEAYIGKLREAAEVEVDLAALEAYDPEGRQRIPSRPFEPEPSPDAEVPQRDTDPEE